MYFLFDVHFVVRETRLAPKMSITLGAGNSYGGEGARGARLTVTKCLVTAMCGFIRARFVACITYILLRHRARYIHDHVIVLFDIIVEQIVLAESTCPSNIVFTRQALIDGYLILPKVFLEFD